MKLSELHEKADYKDEYGMLFNNDCLRILKSIEDEEIDLIATDPPYKVTSRGSAGNSGGMLQKDINKKGMVFKHNSINITQYARELYRILKDGSHLYIMTNHVNLIEMLNVLTSDMRTEDEVERKVKPYSFHFIKSIIWNKENKIMGQYYMSQFEYVLFLRKGKGVRINNCGTSDILTIPNRKTKLNGKNLHDTEKPVDLMTTLVENSSKEGEIVLDPFVGIGSTCIAAKNLNRRYIGIECDENYFEIAVSRLNGNLNED